MPGAPSKLAVAGPSGRPSQTHELRQPLAISAGLHLGILLVLIVGLPFFHTQPVVTPTPISISMVTPSDMARSNHIAPPTEPPEKQEPEVSKANQPPTDSTRPPPPPEPPPEDVTPPKPTPPLPPPPKAEPPAPSIDKLKPIELQKQTIQQMQSLPALQKPMQVIKPKPLKPPVQPPKVTKQQDQDFQSLLTNLSPPVPKADQVSKDKPVKAHPQQSQIGQAANSMTASELAGISAALRPCWIVPAGGYDAENIIITIDAQFREDMTLISATLVDTNDQYNRNPTYRAASDAALRALRNPACSPLPLPPGKFVDWHLIELNFTPPK